MMKSIQRSRQERVVQDTRVAAFDIRAEGPTVYPIVNARDNPNQGCALRWTNRRPFGAHVVGGRHAERACHLAYRLYPNDFTTDNISS
jgi:hypothetical protein